MFLRARDLGTQRPVLHNLCMELFLRNEGTLRMLTTKKENSKRNAASSLLLTSVILHVCVKKCKI